MNAAELTAQWERNILGFQIARQKGVRFWEVSKKTRGRKKRGGETEKWGKGDEKSASACLPAGR